ncbi:MAG TPA: CDP-diacylglycerol--serine O-phosphatidyltransferase [Thermoanaerobaculia bacterium]|nr:CDP-diacylglycerol--serine O-phosphatidyltransferase [Thermoanaerobaculia bacterium]
MTDDRAVERPRARGIRRGAYLLPSLFTMGNMVFGFYAVILGLQGTPGSFRRAALCILLAAALDSVDGRIARMTGTESEFGKEYDSLADVITFGAAPGLLAFLWGLREFSEDAWLISVFYMVCTATRLARFNVQTRVTDSRYFVGLPSPWAALTICALLSFAADSTGDLRAVMQVVMGVALLLIGSLMVSTFRYNSFKKLDLRKRWSYRAFVPFAALLLVYLFIPRATLLVITLLYTLSGPVAAAVSRLRPRRGPRPEDAPPSPVEGAP